LREIFQAGVRTQEGQSDRADRPIAFAVELPPTMGRATFASGSLLG